MSKHLQRPVSPFPRSPSPIALLPTPPRSPAPHLSAPPHTPSSPQPDLKDFLHSPDAPVPVPWKALIPIVLFRISDALTYIVLFPIIADMITSFDVPKDQIGFYSGLAEGILMIVEALVATTWASLADKYGRKPCLIWGFVCTLGAAPMVGFSRTVWQVVFWRALYGLNPAGVLVKIYASEISHPTNRARIFSIFSPSFYIGIMFGSFLGGELAHPYGRLPWWIGGTSEFWRTWPFALPCIVTSAFGLVAVFIGCFSLLETRPSMPGHEGGDTEKPTKRGAYKETLKVPNFIFITSIFCFFQIVIFAESGIYTVYTYTAIDRGGLGMPVDQIGLLFSLGSMLYICSAPFILPRLQPRLGTAGALFFVAMAWPVVALLIPSAQWAAVEARSLMWVILFLNLCVRNFGNYAWPLSDVLTTDIFDDFPHLRAPGAAISLIAGAGGRAIGPTASGWLYSISTGYPRGSLGRQLPWIVLLCLAVPLVGLVRLLPTNAERAKRSNYEALPMAETGRESFDEDDEDDFEVMKVTAVERDSSLDHRMGN